ncbi:unnamed protein product [Rhizophagus irregularis]|nr:unnamed protein product [Rhizophagus irregularis]
MTRFITKSLTSALGAGEQYAEWIQATVLTFYGGNQDPIMWMNEFNNAFAKLLYNILSYLFSALQHDGRILTSEESQDYFQ